MSQRKGHLPIFRLVDGPHREQNHEENEQQRNEIRIREQPTFFPVLLGMRFLMSQGYSRSVDHAGFPQDLVMADHVRRRKGYREILDSQWVSPLPSRILLLSKHSRFQVFPCLKRRNRGCGNLNGFAGQWVSP